MRERPPLFWASLALATFCVLFTAAVSILSPWAARTRAYVETSYSKPPIYQFGPPRALELERRDLRRSPALSKRIADQAIDGTWSIQPPGAQVVWPEITAQLPGIWSTPRIDDPSWKAYLHKLFILHDFVIAHESTSDARYLRKGLEVLVSWVERHPRHSPPDALAWTHARVSQRALSICAFLDYYHHVSPTAVDTPEMRRFIGHTLASHASYIADPRHYAYSNNHGIFQDVALIVIATHLKNEDRARDWLNLAQYRLHRQLEHTFSPQGVHLENSPYYHLWITRLLVRLSNYLDQRNYRHPSWLRHTLASARSVSPYLLTPSGEVVPIGDSPRALKWPFIDDRARGPLRIFPSAGYAVARSPQWYVFFTASNNSGSHKHCDDLAVILGDRHGEVVTDVGFLNYKNQQSSPQRAWSLSYDCHNTISCSAHGPLDRALVSGIDGYGQSRSCMFVSAVCRRPGGVEHRRTVLCDCLDQLLLILDHCRAETRQPRWVRTFQLAPRTSVELLPGDSMRIDRPHGKSLHFSSWPHVRTRVAEGKQSPREGWVAQAFLSLVPAPALKQEFFGDNSVVVAVFTGNHPARIEMDDEDEICLRARSWTKHVTFMDKAVHIRTDYPDGRTCAEEVRVRQQKVESPFHYWSEKPPYPVSVAGRMKLLMGSSLLWSAVAIMVAFSRMKIGSRWLPWSLVLGAAAGNLTLVIMYWERLVPVPVF